VVRSLLDYCEAVFYEGICLAGWWLGWSDGIKKRMGKIQIKLYIYTSANGNLTIVWKAEFFNADGRLGYTRIRSGDEAMGTGMATAATQLDFDSERSCDRIDWQSKKEKEIICIGFGA
jgi:hypothetical protein